MIVSKPAKYHLYVISSELFLAKNSTIIYGHFFRKLMDINCLMTLLHTFCFRGLRSSKFEGWNKVCNTENRKM